MLLQEKEEHLVKHKEDENCFTYLKWILFSQNSHNDKFSRQFNQAKIFRVKNKLYLTYILNKLNENIHK